MFSILVPGTVAGLMPYYLARPTEPPAGIASLGVLPIVLGVIGYASCAWHFSFTGKGTPAPFDAPRRLVVRGPYRFVRNPMYVSVLLVILGQAALFRSPRVAAYAALAALAAHAFVMLYEEPTLRGEFGAEYLSYCSHVRRWLPRLSPWRRP